jgi:hypothetical protein
LGKILLSSEVFNSLIDGVEGFSFDVGSRAACHLLHATFLLGSFFGPEDGGKM